MFSIFYFAITLVFFTILIPVGIIINIKLYRNIKHEEHMEKGKVIQRIMKTFALIQCITWPTLMIWDVLLYLNATIQVIPASWMSIIVFITRLISTLNSDYVSFNSLIIAACRYSFIVFETHAEKLGIKRLRTLFIASSIVVPTFRTVLDLSSNPTDSRFLSEFVYSDDETIQNSSCNTTYTNTYPPSMITDYLLVNDYLPSMLVSAINFTNLTLLILIYSNIIEGFIYFHTFFYSIR